MRMRPLIIITCLLFCILMAGCSGIPIGGQAVRIDDLIQNQEKINSIQISEIDGSNEVMDVALEDQAEIVSVINEVKGIPVKRLTVGRDGEFMLPRIMQKHLSLEFQDYTDPTRTTQGWIMIWPDGYIYVPDIDSMTGSNRTVSYLSEYQYPEIYNDLYSKTQN